MPDASTAAAQAPAAGGAPASPAPTAATVDAPPIVTAGAGTNLPSVNPTTGATSNPQPSPKVVVTNAEAPLLKRANPHFIILHHRVGSGGFARRRGELVHKADLGPNANIDFLLSRGAIAQISNPDGEAPPDPLRPPAATDPAQGLPRGGVKPKGS